MEKVHLKVFEGPLDLLLHLIKKDDIDIYDIPISHVLHQYLEYLNLAKDLDIDLAGEFIEMASELAYIKSKMLLPEIEAEEDEGPDPRADLVARLLEYQRYKLAAQSLMQRPLLGREVFTRPATMIEAEVEEPTIEADTMTLLTAFQNILKRLPKEHVHEVSQARMGVSERIVTLSEFIRGKDRLRFEELFMGVATRVDLIITFLSILEMAKQRLLRIIQERVLQQIFVIPLLVDEAVQEGTGEVKMEAAPNESQNNS